MADHLGTLGRVTRARPRFDPSGGTALTSGVLKLRTLPLSLIGGLLVLAALAFVPAITAGTAHAAAEPASAITGTGHAPTGDTIHGQEEDGEDAGDDDEDNDDNVYITLAIIMLVSGAVIGIGFAAYGLSAE